MNWESIGQPVLANTVFWAECVKRKLEAKELCNVFDIPMDRLEGMTENEINLLIHDGIPGKISYAAMYPLASYYRLRKLAESGNEPVPSPPHIDFTPKRRRMKPERNEDLFNQNDSDKMCRHRDVGGLEEKGDPHSTTKVVSEKMRQQKIGLEGEPAAKAVKSDDSEVPVYLWNERIRDKLVL